MSRRGASLTRTLAATGCVAKCSLPWLLCCSSSCAPLQPGAEDAFEDEPLNREHAQADAATKNDDRHTNADEEGFPTPPPKQGCGARGCKRQEAKMSTSNEGDEVLIVALHSLAGNAPTEHAAMVVEVHHAALARAAVMHVDVVGPPQVAAHAIHTTIHAVQVTEERRSLTSEHACNLFGHGKACTLRALDFARVPELDFT